MFDTKNIHTRGSAEYTACKAAHDSKQEQATDLSLGAEVELLEEIPGANVQLSKCKRGTVLQILTSNQVIVKTHMGIKVTSAASLWKVC